LLEDEPLRADLVARGSARVQGFTWERTARELARVYRAVASGSPLSLPSTEAVPC
jgi:hypothetical protein